MPLSRSSLRPLQRYWARPSEGGKITWSGLECKWDATIDSKGKVTGYLRQCEETDEDGNVLSRVEPDPSSAFESTLGRQFDPEQGHAELGDACLGPQHPDER